MDHTGRASSTCRAHRNRSDIASRERVQAGGQVCRIDPFSVSAPQCIYCNHSEKYIAVDVKRYLEGDCACCRVWNAMRLGLIDTESPPAVVPPPLAAAKHKLKEVARRLRARMRTDTALRGRIIQSPISLF